MKKIFNFMMLACVMILAACSSDDDEILDNNIESDELEMITIGVGLPEDTRIALDNVSLKWEAGDQLKVIGHKKNGKTVIKEFKIDQISASGKSATFTGEMIKNAVSYSVAYNAANLSVDNGEFVINYGNVIQNGINSDAHIKDYILTSADNVKDLKADKIQLTIKNSFLKLNVKSLPDDVKNVRCVSWYINSGSDAKLMGMLNFSGKIVNDAENGLYIPFNPEGAVLNANDKISFSFVGDSYNTVSAMSSKGKAYQAGKKYNITITKAAVEGQKTICTWGTEGAASNELWIKYTAGFKNVQPTKTIGGVKMSLVDQNGDKVLNAADKNPIGWYVYSAEAPVENTQGIANWGVDINDIEEVWFPSTLKEISQKSLNQCIKLKRVIFANVTKIGSQAFLGCSSLKDIVIPSSVTIIDNEAFNGCTNLEKVTFNEGSKLQTIGDFAFRATNIREMVIPASVKNIGNAALRVPDKLYIYSTSDGANFNSTIFSSEYASHACELYLHESWKSEAPKYADWNNSYTWKGFNAFKAYYLIDDNGNVVETHK